MHHPQHITRHHTVIAAILISQVALAQGPTAGTPNPNANKPTDQGFTSKKSGKNLAKSGIEDITNENFPDMIESFDYPNADIADIVKAISELTGKNFIVDPQVRGKITIIAPSRITVAEAYKAFLSALAINGLAVVPGDGFYKIKQARAAQRDNIDTFSGAYYPTSDQMITRIIKLKYISADEVNKQLRILTSTNGELVPYTPTNSLIISDYGANMDRITKILEQLDVQGFEEQLEVIRVVLPAGKTMPPHQVSGEVTVLCIEGRIELTVPQGVRTMQAGDHVYLDAREPHGLRALEDASALVTISLAS